MASGRPQRQAVAISLHNAGIGQHAHRAAGGIGAFSPSMDSPFWARSEARDMDHPEGFINSSVAGRTDRLPLAVATDSHVIPADVVSGLGQGNSLAGADMWQRALRIGPYATPLSNMQARHTPEPRAPSMPQQGGGYASGGSTPGKTPIMAAGGELVVPAWRVGQLGGGDMKKGHAIIDKAIDKVRKYNIEFLKHAPKPKK